MSVLATLRQCLRLQVVEEGYPLDRTLFGRARLLGGIWGPEPRMLYWISLPSYRYRLDWISNRMCWHRAVLYWHGQYGFDFRWEAV